MNQHSCTHGRLVIRPRARNAHRVINRRQRSGVTLMELIVALTITGMMAAVGTAAFGTIIDSKRVIKESTTDTEHAAALRETLRQWLLPATVQIQSGAPPRTGTTRTTAATSALSTSATTRTPNGAEAVTAAAANGDEVTFLTTAPNPANSPNARMRLFIDSDEATPETGLTLEYQVSTQTPLQRRQLDASIKTMTVEYLDAGTSRWYPSDEASTIRPKALRITLGGADGATVTPLLSLPLIFLMNGQTAATRTTN